MAAPLPFTETEMRLLSVLLTRKIRFVMDAAVKAKIEKLIQPITAL